MSPNRPIWDHARGLSSAFSCEHLGLEGGHRSCGQQPPRITGRCGADIAEGIPERLGGHFAATGGLGHGQLRAGDGLLKSGIHLERHQRTLGRHHPLLQGSAGLIAGGLHRMGTVLSEELQGVVGESLGVGEQMPHLGPLVGRGLQHRLNLLDVLALVGDQVGLSHLMVEGLEQSVLDLARIGVELMGGLRSEMLQHVIGLLADGAEKAISARFGAFLPGLGQGGVDLGLGRLRLGRLLLQPGDLAAGRLFRQGPQVRGRR